MINECLLIIYPNKTYTIFNYIHSLDNPFFHAVRVFCSNIATVMGPTPPGTGVIALATYKRSIHLLLHYYTNYLRYSFKITVTNQMSFTIFVLDSIYSNINYNSTYKS